MGEHRDIVKLSLKIEQYKISNRCLKQNEEGVKSKLNQ